MPRTTTNYTKSCVYRIAWKDKTYYVGSTIDFTQREMRHKYACKDVNSDGLLYKFIRDNGGWTEDWCMVLVNEYLDCKSTNELHQYERDAYDFYKPELNVIKPAVRDDECHCIPCGYVCRSISNLAKHLTSKRHIDKVQNPDAEGAFKCKNCDKTYKSNPGLWSHKKNCKPIAVAVAVQVPSERDLHADIKTLTGIVLKMAKDLQPPTINNINDNNYINLFLNYKCHNAYDIKKFIANIDFSKENFDEIIRDYVGGNAKIIMKKYNSLPEYERPIYVFNGEDEHQKVAHIKYDNKWVVERELGWTIQVRREHKESTDDPDKLFQIFLKSKITHRSCQS